jgi:hypothetical protein
MIGYLVKGPVGINPYRLSVDFLMAIYFIEKIDKVFKKIMVEKIQFKDLSEEDRDTIKHVDILSYADHDGAINCEHLIIGRDSGDGTMFALAMLLSDGFRDKTDDPMIGSWAGDQIVIAGDYAKNGRFTNSSDKNLYEKVRETLNNAAVKHNEPGLYKDISNEVRRAIEMVEPGVFSK